MNPEDFLGAFSAKTDDEKQEAFEESTLSVVLRELGASAKRIRYLKEELGPAYGFDWFNDQQLINEYVYAARCFTFSFSGLFTKPEKNPLITMYQDMRATAPDGSPHAVIFKCYDIGRILITNMSVTTATHLCVRLTENDSFNVLSAKGFFSSRYGNIYEED